MRREIVTIVSVHNIKAFTAIDVSQEFASSRVVYEIEVGRSANFSSHGANHHRALAFALRDLSDWLLKEYPRES